MVTELKPSEGFQTFPPMVRAELRFLRKFGGLIGQRTRPRARPLAHGGPRAANRGPALTRQPSSAPPPFLYDITLVVLEVSFLVDASPRLCKAAINCW
jgi:hypothetical protein